MLTPKDFLSKWNNEILPLVNYDIDKIYELQLPSDAKEFLSEVGLPESAPPFLSFESGTEGEITKLKDKFNTITWKKEYLFLGYTGEGDLICVIEESGEVVCISHENEENEMFINSSIPKFMECILEYSEFIKK